MEYDVRDVVIVKGIRSGFYGVVAGKTLLPSGELEYDVAPLDGKSSWRVAAARCFPSDRGFPAKVVDAVLGNFAREVKMPERPALSNATIQQLAVEGIAEIQGGLVIAFEAAKASGKDKVRFDRSLGLYWWVASGA